jgi:NADH-quinone oxidoreductase subunit D
VTGPSTQPGQVVGVGIGAGQLGSDVELTLGSAHPSTHGVLRLRLTLDGDRISTAEPIVGYMHRGAEKLFEVRDYRQILVLANRHDWLSAFANELGLVLGVERMLGIDVPERAVWARTLLAELNRVLSHLMFLGAFPTQVGDGTPPQIGLLAGREDIQAVMEEASGGRMHYMFNRVGGLREDLPDGWPGRVRIAVAAVRARLGALDEVLGAAAFAAELRGVGVLRRELVEGYGISGPLARASGVDFDLRRDEPYLAYGELFVPGGPGRVPTREAGDCLARVEVLREQVDVSLDLVEACAARLDELPAGPINVRLPKVLKAPEGHVYCWTENPLGLNGYYIVSRGEKTPWRCKLRSASFNNVAALRELLPGVRLADLVPIVASLFFVMGDIDK